jgi:phospholipase A1
MASHVYSRVALALSVTLTAALSEAADTTYENCVVQAVMTSEGTRTVESIRAACADGSAAGISTTPVAPEPGASYTPLQARVRSDYDVAARNFAISTHKPNYIMYTHNSEFDFEDSIYADFPLDLQLEPEEVKYQVSFKVPVWRDILGSGTDMYAAYTQTSWWQMFAAEGISSAPFRETNYEPEVFLRRAMNVALPFDGNLASGDLALVHESNGRTDLLSRSWNRVLARAALDYGDLAILVRAWYRIPEDDEEDDNPDTEDYYGYGDVRAVWAPNRNTFTAMLRPGKKEMGMELTWSRRITEELRLYAQWWHGYGESLIDYDQKVNRLGIGIAVNDFLMGGR